MRYRTWFHGVVVVLLAAITGLSAEEPVRPYVLARTATGTIAEHSRPVREALEAEGFEVIGRQVPYEGAEVLVLTNRALRERAVRSDFGGYGAVLRVSLTQVDDQVQISYTNPTWWAHAYRLEGDPDLGVADLRRALGRGEAFGSREGLSVKKLRKYHYTVMMPYFDDQDELARHDSFAEAVAAVEAGLARQAGGAQKVYRVDVDAQTTLFGVALREGHGSDATVMDNCDREALKHTAYMPYEILVSGDRAYALPGKFRIAISFPDLSMGTFMKIARAPGAIKSALRDVAE